MCLYMHRVCSWKCEGWRCLWWMDRCDWFDAKLVFLYVTIMFTEEYLLIMLSYQKLGQVDDECSCRRRST